MKEKSYLLNPEGWRIDEVFFLVHERLFACVCETLMTFKKNSNFRRKSYKKIFKKNSNFSSNRF